MRRINPRGQVQQGSPGGHGDWIRDGLLESLHGLRGAGEGVSGALNAEFGDMKARAGRRGRDEATPEALPHHPKIVVMWRMDGSLDTIVKHKAYTAMAHNP